VNADDFGLSAGVNAGILSCFHNGILRSTSLMPNGAAFEDAVRLARQTPGLGVGVHLSLVGEPCVAPRRELGGLADADGMLPASYAAFARGYFSRRFTQREIQREVAAQMRRVLQAGIRPTHLDSHQHVHLMPGVFGLALQAAQEAGIQVIRVPHERARHQAGLAEPSGLAQRLSTRGLQLNVLSMLSRRARRQARAARLRVAPRFWGLSESGALDEAALLPILARLGRGVNELMSHPGFSDEALRRKYLWGYRWDAEAAALQSPAARQMVEERGIRLAHFGQAWGS